MGGGLYFSGGLCQGDSGMFHFDFSFIKDDMCEILYINCKKVSISSWTLRVGIIGETYMTSCIMPTPRSNNLAQSSWGVSILIGIFVLYAIK